MNSILFVHSICAIRSHILKFEPYVTSFAIFIHLMIYFVPNDPKMESIYKWTQKRLKLCMVSSFDPHNICAKVEKITAKTGCTSCTNWTISFKVRGFQTKTHLFQRHFILPNLFLTQDFCLHSTCTIQSHILKFQPFLTSFTIFHAFNDLFWAKWPWN